MVNESLQHIVGVVEAIPDPEIPVLTLADLGVIRDVAVEDGSIIVTVTPTYSGCPAISLIEEMIVEQLQLNNFENVKIRRSISPPWSSDWITSEGKAKLTKYGIAPPNSENKGQPESCPRCRSGNVAKISEFSSTPCQAMWKCLSCLEVFGYFKCI